MLSSFMSFMLAWFNLPFTLLLAICLLLVALQWIGLGGDHETDSEADGDAGLDHDIDGHFDHDLDTDSDFTHDIEGQFDHDLETDADVTHDFDSHLDHDVEGHLEHDLDNEIGPSSLGDGQHAGETGSAGEAGFSILAYLGIGRAPLLVILLLLFGSVGLTGWLFNGFAIQAFGVYPGPLFVLALAVALGLGSLVSSRITRAIGHALPPISSTATKARALVGRRGIVISPFVDRRYGMVHLRDTAGTLISVFAVTSEDPPIRRGEEVLFVDYEPHQRLYSVIRIDRSH